eukprot:9714671-Alexandrium_andersonii.AAC.1
MGGAPLPAGPPDRQKGPLLGAVQPVSAGLALATSRARRLCHSRCSPGRPRRAAPCCWERHASSGCSSGAL